MACGLQSTGAVVVARAWLLRGMCDLPGPGLEPALAGGFLTTGPPGKPNNFSFYTSFLECDLEILSIQRREFPLLKSGQGCKYERYDAV